MAQDNRHCITEQLSAAIDAQLTAAEQAQLDAHLSACEQCQQRLAALRGTVALLHALPQPVLPRSFVLPIPLNETGTAAIPETPALVVTKSEGTLSSARMEPVSMAAYRGESATITAYTPRRSRRANYVRTALRTMSAFAAVAGLLLLLSGVFTTSYLTGAMTSAPEMTAQQQPGASLPHTNDASPPVPASATPTALAEQRIAQAKATPTVQPVIPSPSVVEPFWDLGTIVGRMSIGFLLLLLGLIGVVVFRKRRYQQEILS